jgi:hypothetical protein
MPTKYIPNIFWSQEKLYVSIFFGLLFVLGLVIYQDYGVGWDEIVERMDGAVSLQYALQYFDIKSITPPHELLSQTFMGPLQFEVYKDKYYPVGFNLPLAIVESLFQFPNQQAVYFVRHLLTFAIFLIGVYSVFWIAKKRFSSWKIGLLAATFLIISPRMFAESFYNSKDMVLLSMFALGLATAIQFIFHNSLKSTLIHGIVCGFAMEIRLMAIALPMMTLVIFLIYSLSNSSSWKKVVFSISLYLLTIVLFLLLTWPLLWTSPLENFLAAFKFMSNFKVSVDMLYWGSTIVSTQLPWHYPISWVIITTPVLILILWSVGFFFTCLRFFTQFSSALKNQHFLQDMLFISLSIGPVAGTILVNTSLYDGWRHLYFIYPAMILIAIKGWVTVYQICKAYLIFKLLLHTLTILSLLTTVVWMVRAHPYQNVYFNFLAGEDWKSKFDVDYWGMSNLNALQNITKSDQRPNIKIWLASYLNLKPALSLLDPQAQSRIQLVDRKEDADYIVSNYRNSPNTSPYTQLCFEKFYEIQVVGETILSVFKQKNSSFNSFEFSNHNYGICYFRGSGWAEPESWGTWSIGPSAEIQLPLPNQNQKTLNIDVKSLGPNQKVRIFVNEIPIKVWSLDSAKTNTLSFYLSHQIIQSSLNNSLQIRFESLYPISPSSLGIGKDSRNLGIGLISAYF